VDTDVGIANLKLEGNNFETYKLLYNLIELSFANITRKDPNNFTLT